MVLRLLSHAGAGIEVWCPDQNLWAQPFDTQVHKKALGLPEMKELAPLLPFTHTWNSLCHPEFLGENS